MNMAIGFPLSITANEDSGLKFSPWNLKLVLPKQSHHVLPRTLLQGSSRQAHSRHTHQSENVFQSYSGLLFNACFRALIKVTGK
jgi:hypothetical protein